jgi:hypothetical protein
LRARAREAVDELQDALARAIADTSSDPHPALTAALAMAACRTTFTAGAARVLAGERAAAVTKDHIAAVEAAFDTLAEGLR